MAEELDRVISEDDLIQLLEKANEISELLQRAVKLGYSISMHPAQMRIVIEILECAQLIKIPERTEP